MFFGNRKAKEAERTLADVKPQLVALLSEVGDEFEGVKFRAERVLEGELTEYDREQIAEATRGIEENLDACRHALYAIQSYERSKELDVKDFRHLKKQLLMEDDDPDEIAFDTSHEAIQWVATRALRFAEYVRDTQLPWFRRSLGEAQDALESSVVDLETAAARRSEARGSLTDAEARYPSVDFVYARQRLEELEERWLELERIRERNQHADTAAYAQALDDLALEVMNCVRETEQFLEDPRMKFAEAQEFMDELRSRLTRAAIAVPQEYREAEETLTECRAEAAKPQVDWTEAARLYSRASALAAQAAAYLPEEMR